MVIKKIRLENFRGFEGVHEFELHSDHINVIIGANGAGKSSVLDAISYIFNEIYKNDWRRKMVDPDRIDHLPNVTFSRNKTNVQFDFISNNKMNEIGYDFEKHSYNYKANFYPKNHSIPDEIVFKKYGSIRKLLEGNYQNNFISWFREQMNIQNNEKVKKGDLNYEIKATKLLNNAVNTFLLNLSDHYFSRVALDKSLYKDKLVLFLEKKDKTKIEYDQLSSGEKAIFTLVLEVAQDSYIYSPALDNPLLSNGIVLIDEIELHLHPKWQVSVLQALKKTFPNIQFIVTTHSPLVINHLKNENLILLDDFKITEGINVQNTYGRDVNSIITDFMGASAKPKDVENLINDIEVLLDEEQPNINLAKEKLSVLKKIVDPNESEVLKLETLITIEEED